MRVIVGMAGASGFQLGISLLKALKKKGVETHVVATDSAKKVAELEACPWRDVEKLATTIHNNNNLAAPISSGSFQTAGMVIAPCSMNTVAMIAHGFTDSLLLRAADVCLKERRKLILLARETPLSSIHLKNMLTVTRAGGVILPPLMSFYSRPKTVEDMKNHITGKTLDMLGIENTIYRRWSGNG